MARSWAMAARSAASAGLALPSARRSPYQSSVLVPCPAPVAAALSRSVYQMSAPMPGSAAAVRTAAAAISAWRPSVTWVVSGPMSPGAPSEAAPGPPVGAPTSVSQIGSPGVPVRVSTLRRLSLVRSICSQAVPNEVLALGR
ncbi:hypothetical protein GCM10010442_17890 [Kitasatospora kifunensis]